MTQSEGSQTLFPPEGHLPVGERPKPGPRPPRSIWTGENPNAQGANLSTVDFGELANNAEEKANAELAVRKPVGKRVVGIDVARGFAVIGMMAVHTMPAAHANGEETWAWALFSGKSAPLFALLAGVSLAFMTGGRRPYTGLMGRRTRASIATRAVVLLLLGLLVNTLLKPGAENILPYYGLMFLFAVPFTSLRIRHLIVAASGFLLVGPILMFLVFKYVTIDSISNPVFADMVQNPAMTTLTLLLTGTYPAITWMFYVCLGMALGRMKLTEASVQFGIAVAGGVLIVVTTIISDLVLWWLPTHDVLMEATMSTDPAGKLLDYSVYGGAMGSLPTDHPLWLFVAGPHANTAFSEAYGAGFALVALGLLSLATAKFPKLFHPLAVLGTMTLTIYVLHLIALDFLIYADNAPLERAPGLVIQIVAAIIFALIWKQFFSQGLLEKPVAVISKRSAAFFVRDADGAPASRKDLNPPLFDPTHDQV